MTNQARLNFSAKTQTWTDERSSDVFFLSPLRIQDDVSTQVRTTSNKVSDKPPEDFDRGDYEVEPALLYRTICFLSGFIYI